MSAPVVLIGYILLIPSILGIVVTVLMYSVVDDTTSKQLAIQKLKARRGLANIDVPSSVIEKVINSQSLSSPELSSLTGDQRRAVDSVKRSLLVEGASSGLTGALFGGTFICLGGSCFIGGLLGWLLVMKKKVLRCNKCGAVVAAS